MNSFFVVIARRDDAAATRFEDQRAARRERLTARGQAYESV